MRYRLSALIFGRMLTTGVGLVLSCASFGQTFVRMDLRPFETLTLTSPQFLNGETTGKPVMLAGELRIPKPGTDRLPAVILMHGSGGINAGLERWAQELNGIGVATFIVDSFGPRGIGTTLTGGSLSPTAAMVDAYRALQSLAAHPRIDPTRIAIMGFSRGALAAVYSASERFRKIYGSDSVQFAAHIGLYTACEFHYIDDDKTTGRPIRMFHGIDDDYDPIEKCRAHVARLRTAGADVVLTEYPGAHHLYDAFNLPKPLVLEQAVTLRSCSIEEGPDGRFLNTKTGRPFDLNDPCVEKGPHIAYNAAAHQATVSAVKGFLSQTFHLE